MDEQTFKAIAQQLRQPQGEHGIEVGRKMNESNLYINRYTVEALKPSAGDNILEIGMGNGLFVKDILAAHDSVRYTGCDFSELMVNEASVNNEKFIKSGKVKFHLANADKLPVESGMFNKVFTVNTIYFWNDPPAVFSEISRVLKPGGQLFISLRPKSVMEHYPFVKYGFKMFTKEDLVSLVSKNNFHVTDAMEKPEPDQEIGGRKMKVETLIVCAKK